MRHDLLLRRFSELIYLLLALFFLWSLYRNISELIPCIIPPPPPHRGQMDGLTCNWPTPYVWKIRALAFSIPGLLFSILALLNKSHAKLWLAATFFFIGVLAVVDLLNLERSDDYPPMTFATELVHAVPFSLAALLFYEPPHF